MAEIDAWETIIGCFRDGTGVGILGEYIEETDSLVDHVSNRTVPIVLVNGNVTEISELRTAICSNYVRRVES